MHGIICNVLAAGVLAASSPALYGAQQARMKEYENQLEKRIEERVEAYRLRRLNEERVAAAQARRPVVTPRTSTQASDLNALSTPFRSVVNLYDSNSGEGQDVEIRLTMPIDAFMDFAPLAALEAAALPHKFPVVYIFVREETTDRVARVAFKDAEPIAGRYLANDENAVSEMKDALIWH